MVAENFTLDDVVGSLSGARLLEDYPQHKRGACALCGGVAIDGRPVHIVCTTANPVLVVCDRANQRLQWFDLDGRFLRAAKPREMVSFPAHIDIQGDVMMVADLHARISLFNKSNTLITHLGENPRWRAWVVGSLDAKNNLGPAVRSQPKTWEAGKFVHPHDACFDAHGNIYVAEWVDGGRISFLKKVG